MTDSRSGMMRVVAGNEDGSPYIKIKDFFSALKNNALTPTDANGIQIVYDLLTGIFPEEIREGMLVNCAHLVEDYHCASIGFRLDEESVLEFAMLSMRIINWQVTTVGKPIVVYQPQMIPRRSAEDRLAAYRIFFSAPPLYNHSVVDLGDLPEKKIPSLIH